MGKEVAGDVVTRRPGESPHPILMNSSVIHEIEQISPAAVVVKGDITDTAQDVEFKAFENHYGAAFNGRLYAVRGNHESFYSSTRYSEDLWIELPGIAMAVLDTCVDGADGGHLTGSQLDWLMSHLESATVPVLIFGHHPPCLPGYGDNPGQTLDVASSEALVDACTSMPNVLSYSAGHSHRTRSRTWAGVVYSEVGCVKDFPGLWTEFEVFEGGVVQLVHRIRNREAVAWSDSCRNLYQRIGIEYETYALGLLADRCTVLNPRL
ncbi:metallophosphoesterase [Streptomyces sp. NPDC001833]|uniref:metallophosphoesterase family protein n=1 Tax=Streptomyces sp. NPDC001833 TaxID=3154658 RepID=UPI00332EF498